MAYEHTIVSRTKSLRRLDSTEADVLKTIMDYLDLLQVQGKLLWVRHSPSNVILSWNVIWNILTDLYHHQLTIRLAFNKIRSACFRKMRESQAGIADIFVFRGGLRGGAIFDHCDVLCIEVKSTTGKLQTAQDRWAGLALDQGMRHIVARSLEDVQRALR